MAALMESRSTIDWTPAGWQTRTAGQQPLYRDAAEVETVVEKLNKLPPLVTWQEIEALKSRLAAAQRGEQFLLQGGDCAESFDDCTAEFISNKLKILLQMSLVLLHGMEKKIIRVGRIAGQYAKPRSAEMETVNGKALPSYRGDLINRSVFHEAARTPDPTLMLRGYERAAMTLNYVRALIDGVFADLHHPEYWDLAFVNDSPLAPQYREIVGSIDQALNRIANESGRTNNESGRVDFHTSHEGLHLLYEQAQTHFIEEQGRWYNQSTHFPWIGVRTAALDGAHVEYFRGIANPIAVKVGAGIADDELQELVNVLNPDDEPGRLTLIHRLGAAQVADELPRIIRAVQATGKTVLWSCDPMHGNTETTAGGIKTRRFENIMHELEQAFAIHAAQDSWLGGIHVELTGENVTECLGGAGGLTESDLKRAYKSPVDPRLNYEQALELAMRIVKMKG